MNPPKPRSQSVLFRVLLHSEAFFRPAPSQLAAVPVPVLPVPFPVLPVRLPDAVPVPAFARVLRVGGADQWERYVR